MSISYKLTPFHALFLRFFTGCALGILSAPRALPRSVPAAHHGHPCGHLKASPQASPSENRALVTACPGGSFAANSRHSPTETDKLRRVKSRDHLPPPTPPWHSSRQTYHPDDSLAPGSPSGSLTPTSCDHQLRPQRYPSPPRRPSSGACTAPYVDPVLKERPAAPFLRLRVTAARGSGARTGVWDSGNLDPGVYTITGPWRTPARA